MKTTNTARVIVGIDGSEQALAAVRAAATEAHRRTAPLRIVHAFIWPALHVDVRPVASDLPETGLRHHAENLLKEATAAAEMAAPQVPVTTVLIDGAATPVLLKESHGAALLVLGDRGLGGVSGLIIGSVAVHAAAHARCPVLVVRGAEPTGGPVVVGVDGSEASRLAVGFAFEESAYRLAELVPVLAWTDNWWCWEPAAVTPSRACCWAPSVKPSCTTPHARSRSSERLCLRIARCRQTPGAGPWTTSNRSSTGRPRDPDGARCAGLPILAGGLRASAPWALRCTSGAGQEGPHAHQVLVQAG